ncbi:MAG: TonB C-terminal domain-containing protein, partial [Myxococcales bacterium]
ICALEGPGARTTRRAGDPAPDPALQHAREAMEVASHVEEITRRTRGRDRVEKGLVDAYFVEMKQAMERKLQGRDIAAARDPARASLQTFSGAMERFGRTGNPYAEGAGQGPELEALNHAGHVASTPELSQLRAMARFSHEALLGAYAGELTAIVEIRQGRNGRLLELKLRQSSGQLDFDALALEAVPAAMAELVPPESGAGIHADGVHALFAFVGRVVQLPPVMAGGGAATIVGGTFDPALGHLDVRAPGQSRFSCSVRLLEVY